MFCVFVLVCHGVVCVFCVCCLFHGVFAHLLLRVVCICAFSFLFTRYTYEVVVSVFVIVVLFFSISLIVYCLHGCLKLFFTHCAQLRVQRSGNEAVSTNVSS